MKRIIWLALSTLLITALSASLALAAPPRLTLASAGTTGIYYSLGGVIAQALKEKGVADITVQATGGASENLRLITKKEVQIAFTQNDLAYAAFNGLEPFPQKLDKYRAICSTHGEQVHAVASAESKMKKLNDFVGHKISLGPRGGGNEANCRQIFPFYGVTYQNISPVFLPYGESADMFKDRQIDGFMFTFPYPHPVMLDITTTQDVQFLPIEGDIADQITAKFPYLFKTTIPANTYRGQTEAVNTLGVKAMLVVQEDMPDDVVYAITKGIFENLPTIAANHNTGKEMSLDKALEAVTVPLHPGAERYFKEKGLIK